MTAKLRFIDGGAGRRWIAPALLGLFAASGACHAQGADPATGAAAVPVPDSPQVKPTAAMMAAHAETGLLLGIVDTGQHLVAVGGNGDIVTSPDGERWTQVHTPVDVTLTGVAFADAHHGWAVGHDALILHTADGGLSWSVQSFQPDLNAPLFSVLALDPRRALAVGAFGTLKATEDGGGHWSDVDAPVLTKDKLHLNAITRLANGDLFIAGEHGLAAVSADGRDWHRLSPPYEGSFFGALPWGSRGAIAFGLRGNVYVSDDARADHWQKVDAHTTSSFFGGLALPQGEVALMGGDGEIVIVDGKGAGRVVRDSSSGQGQATTYAAGIEYHNALIVVGEAGVARVSLK